MDNMSFNAVAPVVMLSAGALLVLLYDIAFTRRPWVWGVLSGGSIVAALVFVGVHWEGAVGGDNTGSLHFSNMLAVDGFSAFAGLVMVLVAGLGLLVAWDLVDELGERGAEFVSLVLISAAGFHLMASATDLVFVFLGLEVASISLYVLAGYTRDRVDADESALKYFLLGAFASAIFLYGVALFYASTGETSLYRAGAFLRDNVLLEPGLLLVAIGLMVVGLGFKVSAAPFHMWAPDVYQGAPGGIVGYMAAAAKVGAFAALARLLVVGVGPYVDDWAPVVAALAAVSVVLGTVLAIAQTDFKRMLAYSSVAHAGFMLTGLVAGIDGVPAMWFYLSTYSFQVIAAFAVAAVVRGSAAGRSELTDYAGLGSRNPVLALVLMIMMLAMGGIPLTAGFVGKAGVFRAAIDAGYLWLAVVGVLAATAGLFFYLRVVVLMYMQAPGLAEAPGADTARPVTPFPTRVGLAAAVAVTVVFGIAPWPLLNTVADALPL